MASARKKWVLERKPLKELGESKRYIILEPRIDALLDGHIDFGLFPQWSTQRFISVFCAGWIVRVNRKKTKLKPDVERLEGYDEVWALCIRARTVPPGWRVLGRFYDKDVFIGLRAWDKRYLFSRYDEAAQEVIEDWQDFFGDQPPHRGKAVADYLSMSEDLDEPI